MLPAGGTSINPTTTGTQDLSNYFDNQNRSQAGGFRAPIINIATGGSTLTPNITASQGEAGAMNMAVYIAAGLVALWLLKRKG